MFGRTPPPPSFPPPPPTPEPPAPTSAPTHTYTAEVLFDIVDTDSSGVLEKAEFVYMHTMVLNSEKRAAARVAEAKAAAPPCCMVM